MLHHFLLTYLPVERPLGLVVFILWYEECMISLDSDKMMGAVGLVPDVKNPSDAIILELALFEL
ncbi:hypothetical protein PCCS19_45320 [Paenibacillus sp. CCS19]|nr:hypothetical protein PCCS19_45320 [Paenibacillus cellulosilyticus]